ncbi:MAG TPA: BlaI/MecI/CopY family transcriptional regulator [Clostridiales bacterium]|nr:BlaI/MecI/CopY family transcriptional regulator [Clostridiales bacterium]
MNKYRLISSQITKDEYYSNLSIHFVEDTFGGSLPKFLTAFIGGRKLSNNQVEELKKLIDEHKEVQ